MDPNPADPLALIIAGGAAVISSLAGIVLMMISSRVKSASKAIESVTNDVTGKNGLFVRITTVEGKILTAEANIDGLKKDTLTKQMFEQSIESQNRTLEELKSEGHVVAHKVDKINYTLASRPWSQSGSMPAAHPVPREEPDSDPPVPPRPRLPSRPK